MTRRAITWKEHPSGISTSGPYTVEKMAWSQRAESWPAIPKPDDEPEFIWRVRCSWMPMADWKHDNSYGAHMAAERHSNDLSQQLDSMWKVVPDVRI